MPKNIEPWERTIADRVTTYVRHIRAQGQIPSRCRQAYTIVWRRKSKHSLSTMERNMNRRSLLARIVAVVCLLLGAAGAEASYAIYVGNNLTSDGSVFLAGYGDEPSSHWLEIVPRRQHAAD